MLSDLLNYSVKDFVLDESFQQWILNSDKNITSFWETWQQKHQEKNHLISEAKLLLLIIKSAIDREIEIDAQEIWIKIEKSIEKDQM